MTTGSYTVQSFNDYYTKRLEAFTAKLRALIYDTVFIMSFELSCKRCYCRVFIRPSGAFPGNCVMCHKVHTRYPNEVKALLKQYPDSDQCRKEWLDKGNKPPRVKTTVPDERLQFGKRLRALRESKGLSKEDLANMIINAKDKPISQRTISGYETGHGYPTPRIMKQLEEKLGFNVVG